MLTVNAFQARLRYRVQGFMTSDCISSQCHLFWGVRLKLTRFGVHVFEHCCRRFGFFPESYWSGVRQLRFWQIWAVMEDDRWNPVLTWAPLKDLSNQNMDPSTTESTTQRCNEKTVKFHISFFPFCVCHKWWHDKSWDWGQLNHFKKISFKGTSN